MLGQVMEAYGANENLTRSLQGIFWIPVDRWRKYIYLQNVHGIEFRRTEIFIVLAWVGYVSVSAYLYIMLKFRFA
jgi:hypothetical protein